MVFDLEGSAARAFREVYGASPLKLLDQPDQTLLFSLATVYASVLNEAENKSLGFDELERVAKIAADAAVFGAKMESEVFGGPYSDLLSPFTAGFRDIPRQLISFSTVLGELLGSLGKQGHKETNVANQFLVMMSEFVRLKTGQYYDEHLAAVYHAVLGERSLPKDGSDELSGDAIRKKRIRLQTLYPRLYAVSLEKATILSKSKTP